MLSALGSLAVLVPFLALSGGLLSASPQQESDTQSDRAKAYYHYALAHLNMLRAADFGRQEYIRKALDHYDKAIAADPESDFLRLELVKFYGRTNRLDDAIAEAEKLLEGDPDNIEVRKVLGNFLRSYAGSRRGSLDKDMLQRAVEQFERVLEIDPKDEDALLQLSTFYRILEDNKKSEESLRKLLEIKPDSTEAWSNLAQLYLSMGETERAIEGFEKVRAAGATDTRSLASLGGAYESVGRHREAAEIFNELLGQSGGNGQRVRRALANNLVLSGQFSKALPHYERLVEAEPDNPEHHLRLSQIQRQKRNFDEAWEHLRKAAELAPESLEIKYNSVLLFEAEGKTDEAVEGMERLLAETEKERYTARDRQNRALFLEQLGSLYRRQEQVPRAVEIFDAMAEMDPKSRPRALAHAIDSYRSARNYEQARERSAQAYEEFPDDRRLTILRATVLAETGDAAKGGRILKSLLKSDQRDLETHLALAQVYEKGKKFDAALKSVKAAAELADTREQKLTVLFTHGSVLERAKRHDAAEEKFRELIAADPDNASALNYLGYMLADLNQKLEEAHDMIQKALDLDPGNGAYLDSLGWLYYRQQKLDLAERYLLRSLESVKRDPIVHSHLADVYFQRGKVEQARKHWERSLEEWRNSPKADQDPKEIARLQAKLAELKVEFSSSKSRNQNK